MRGWRAWARLARQFRRASQMIILLCYLTARHLPRSTDAHCKVATHYPLLSSPYSLLYSHNCVDSGDEWGVLDDIQILSDLPWWIVFQPGEAVDEVFSVQDQLWRVQSEGLDSCGCPDPVLIGEVCAW